MCGLFEDQRGNAFYSPLALIVLMTGVGLGSFGTLGGDLSHTIAYVSPASEASVGLGGGSYGAEGGGLTDLSDFGSPLPGIDPGQRGFGMRLHPIHGDYRMHNGQDFGAGHGAPIVSPAHGKIISNGWDAGGYGNYVVIEHPQPDGSVVHTLYAHLSENPGNVGQFVAPGESIGSVGSTGGSTGPHLHYEIFTGAITGQTFTGSRVDPASHLSGNPGASNSSVVGPGGSIALSDRGRQAIKDLFGSPEMKRAMAAASSKSTATSYRSSTMARSGYARQREAGYARPAAPTRTGFSITKPATSRPTFRNIAL